LRGKAAPDAQVSWGDGPGGDRIEVEMGIVVVTIVDGAGLERDVELPSHIPLRLLAPVLAHALGRVDLNADGSPVRYVLKQHHSAEVLPMDRTLEAAGVVHGDRLMLMVKPVPAPLIGAAAEMPFTGPGLIAPSGATFPFRAKSLLVGRADPGGGIARNVLGADLTVLDTAESPSVSRRHARVFLHRGSWFLEDLRSTNGSEVNGLQLRPGERVRLKDGCEVRFGDVSLVFVWDSQEATRESAGPTPSRKGDRA
jgi:hypothetical protein